MFDRIKCFGKVQFKQNNLSRRCLALMNVFKRPCKAILYGSTFEESLLVSVNDFKDYFLQAIGQDLRDDF